MPDFVVNTPQRFALNNRLSLRDKNKVEAPQVSILRWPMFLVWINDVSEKLASNPELFLHDASLFSEVRNIDESWIDFNYDVNENKWIYIMNNLDPAKQALTLFVNQDTIEQNSLHKLFKMFLDSR